MGLTASFAVQATGQQLRYQWSRGSAPIPGATGRTYTTPPTLFTDSGSLYTVTVTNASGSVTTTPASLTITARAPLAGDLRFQQVDAASTVNGYTQDGGLIVPLVCPILGQNGLGEFFAADFGTAFVLRDTPCIRAFLTFLPPVGVAGLSVGYVSTPAQLYQQTLIQTFSPGAIAPNDSGSVIHAISFEPSGSLALGFVHNTLVSGFDRAQFTLPASGLQALASQEGLRGRVITALSYDGAQVIALSYGWTGDPSSVYESKAVFATLYTAADAIKQLAGEGYILTASGSTQAADGSGIVLLGTRVQGDTMPRPLLTADLLTGSDQALLSQGYAVVAFLQDLQSYPPRIFTMIGER